MDRPTLENLVVRVRPAWKTRLAEHAEKKEMNMSEYIRDALRRAMESDARSERRQRE